MTELILNTDAEGRSIDPDEHLFFCYEAVKVRRAGDGFEVIGESPADIPPLAAERMEDIDEEDHPVVHKCSEVRIDYVRLDPGEGNVRLWHMAIQVYDWGRPGVSINQLA